MEAYLFHRRNEIVYFRNGVVIFDASLAGRQIDMGAGDACYTGQLFRNASDATLAGHAINPEFHAGVHTLMMLQQASGFAQT